MSTPALVALMITVAFIATIAACLIAEHRCNKRNEAAAGTDNLLIRLSAQCNARPQA